jgi:hypothetical protein
MWAISPSTLSDRAKSMAFQSEQALEMESAFGDEQAELARAQSMECSGERMCQMHPQLHDRLPPCHPVRRLYATLCDQAHAAIATAQQADRALVEE